MRWSRWGEEEDAVLVRDSAGVEIALEKVHAQTQADPEIQGRLYREAMTLWH